MALSIHSLPYNIQIFTPTVAILSFMVLVSFINSIHGRILRINSSDDLISDGIDHVDSESPALTANGYLLSSSTCQHTYGFLPCAENAGGYIFQILIYQGLLIFGEKQLSMGSKVLFNIFGNSKVVGIIFRILTGLPAMMMMILSGVFGSKKNAQSLVSLGVGIYAGISVFTLTLQWGICLIVGGRKLQQESTPEHSEFPASCCLRVKEKLTELKDTGITIDDKTRYTAGIMLLSLIPYVIVQLVDIFNTSHIVILIALIVSASSLVSYFIYQNLNPWIQQRSLDYSKYEILRTGFLKHLEQLGKLVDEDGKLNIPVIKNLFAETDRDKDRSITRRELEKLVLDVMKTGKLNVNKQLAVSEVMKSFDFNNDEKINVHEFIEGCKNWIAETNPSSSSTNFFDEDFQRFNKINENRPEEIDLIMSKILKHAESQILKAESLVTEDGKPNTDSIKSLFRQFDNDNNNEISKTELEQLIRTVKFEGFQPNYKDVIKELFKDFDKDGNHTIDEPEFVDGVEKWIDKAIQVADCSDKTSSIDEFDRIVWEKVVYQDSFVWACVKCAFRIVLGIVILTFLGGPLTTSILQLSYAMRVPSFSISFVIVPLAMNMRTLIEAIFPASKKTENTANLTFSEIYGAVVMNNISGLTTLLAVVYAKDLPWDYSAEVLTVLVVCAVVGILGYSRTSYPLWTCLLAFFLYPFSLALFCYVQLVLHWN
ncbi:sodium/calcium exchanger family protein/calcium-binding EF hand family protein [Abeliophyllum distichum]|uniref:Sodium/calcium exchanger family protein/calcium-binding EF hand family protein n=1 Tax=Abeliophyllum distichum TaxID=126358 RepID=A0ABD1QGC6_9LAMI